MCFWKEKKINVNQGSEKWLEHRSDCYEALKVLEPRYSVIMCTASPYMLRLTNHETGEISHIGGLDRDTFWIDARNMLGNICVLESLTLR